MITRRVSPVSESEATDIAENAVKTARLIFDLSSDELTGKFSLPGQLLRWRLSIGRGGTPPTTPMIVDITKNGDSLFSLELRPRMSLPFRESTQVIFTNREHEADDEFEAVVIDDGGAVNAWLVLESLERYPYEP